jgi:hypothetical protein
MEPRATRALRPSGALIAGRLLAIGWLVIGTLGVARPALAQDATADEAARSDAGGAMTQDQAMAEELFRRGVEAMEAERLEEACGFLEQSLQLDLAPGTLWHLSLCRERRGQIASAWAAARRLETLSQRRGETERAAVARERAAALEPRLSRVAVTVEPPARVRDLEIVLDARTLSSAAWNVELPIDLGEHALEARAPGRVAWQHAFSVTEESSTTRLEVPELAIAPDADVPAEPWYARTAGWILGGAAVVALGVGIGFLVSSFDLEARASARGLDLADRDRLASEAAVHRIVSLSVLGAAVLGGTGAALVWTGVL